MAETLQVTYLDQAFVGFGDIVSMDYVISTFGGDGITGATIALAGLTMQERWGASDSCFFGNENPCTPPVWALVSGSLPLGVLLDAESGVYTNTTAIILIRGNGPNQFTVSMTDACGNVLTETYYVQAATSPTTTPPDTPGGSGTPSGCWTLGDLFTISTVCAYQGTYGLRRVADGVIGDSDTVSSASIAASAGQTYFLSFYLKGSGGADGTIGFGLSFYDSDGVLISSSFVTSTGSPTSWTQFLGNVTAPSGAVLAVPTIRATGHLNGAWCFDQSYAILSGGFFILSGIKHYFSEFISYR